MGLLPAGYDAPTWKEAHVPNRSIRPVIALSLAVAACLAWWPSPAPAADEGAPAALVRAAWKSRWAAEHARIQDHIDHDRGEAALAAADALLQEVRASGDLKELAEVLLLRGEALLGLDRAAEAGSMARTALGIGSLLGDPHVLACAFNDLGILAEDAGRVRGAATFYRQAYRHLPEFEDQALKEAILFDLGSAECRTGREEEGFVHLEEGRTAALGRGDRLAETRFLVRIAEFRQEYAKPEAEKLALQALEQARQLRHAPSEQGAERTLARCRLVAKDLPGAEKHFRAALDVAKRSGSAWGEAQAAFELGLFQVQTGKRSEAIAPLERAASLFRKLGRKDLADEVKELLQRLAPARAS
jgi:tetratricopeptide (TPR) repeat protein